MSEWDINSLIRLWSNDIRMSLELERSKQMVNGNHDEVLRKQKPPNTLPVIRYLPADIKTRYLLTIHGWFYPKYSTLRLYAK